MASLSDLVVMARESLLIQFVGENEMMSICSALFPTAERLQGEGFEDC